MFGSSSSHVQFGSLLLILAVVLSVQATDDVKFVVPYVAVDTPGGQLFMEKIGVDFAKDLMSSTTQGVWEFIFWQGMDIRVKVQKICLYIDKITTISSSKLIASHTYEIRLGAKHIERCKNYMKEEISMLIYYEIGHILQNTGKGKMPPALFDGIAAYVVIKFRSKKPKQFAKCEDGSIWDQCPLVVGQFLDYCADEYTSFVETLNKKMVASYTDHYFVEISGKTIEELWKEYKSKHDCQA